MSYYGVKHSGNLFEYTVSLLKDHTAYGTKYDYILDVKRYLKSREVSIFKISIEFPLHPDYDNIFHLNGKDISVNCCATYRPVKFFEIVTGESSNNYIEDVEIRFTIYYEDGEYNYRRYRKGINKVEDILQLLFQNIEFASFFMTSEDVCSCQHLLFCTKRQLRTKINYDNLKECLEKVKQIRTQYIDSPKEFCKVFDQGIAIGENKVWYYSRFHQ